MWNKQGILQKMVGTTRFELATSPTPRERSTRLSHVPTCCYYDRSHLYGPAVWGMYSLHQCVGATYSLGSSPPVPKKNSFICSTRNSWASRVQGWRRYSLSSIFWRSIHSPQAVLETFL